MVSSPKLGPLSAKKNIGDYLKSMSVAHLGEEEVEVRMMRLPGTLLLSPGEGEGDRDTGSEEWLAYSGSGLPAVTVHGSFLSYISILGMMILTLYLDAGSQRGWQGCPLVWEEGHPPVRGDDAGQVGGRGALHLDSLSILAPM